MRFSDAVHAFVRSLRRRNRSTRTIENYGYWLDDFQRFHGDAALAAITVHDLRAWLDATLEERKVGAYTLWTMVVTVQAFFNWCVREGLLEASPAQALEKPRLPQRLPKALEVDDVQRLLRAAREGKHPERDVALLLFMLDTGVRLGAVASLTLDCLYLGKSMALVHTKGDVELSVFFDAATKQALLQWLQVRDPDMFRMGVPANSVFGLRPAGIRQVIRRWRTRAGLRRRVSAHTFRHTSATWRVERGISEQALQQIMGWRDSRMANVYTRLASHRLRRISQATSPIAMLNLDDI